jgi:predicted amidohydrolase YtcJ
MTERHGVRPATPHTQSPRTDRGSIALVDGRVHTMDQTGSIAEAVLIEHGLITLVGSTDEVIAAAAAETPVEQLAGRVVLPGLIDAHTHVELLTVSKQFWLDVREQPREVTIARIRAAVSERTEGQWIVAQGTFGQDLPSRSELDEISPDHPVLVLMTVHKQVANSRALAAAGIHEDSVPPRGSWYYRDETGRLTGVVQEGLTLFPIPWPSTDQLEHALRTELGESFARHGVTTILELPASAAGVGAYTRVQQQGELPVRLGLTLTVGPGLFPLIPDLDAFAESGFSTGFGNDQLWFTGLKIFVDGDGPALFARSNREGEIARWNLLTRDRNELTQALTTAFRQRTRVWFHVGGDLAQELVMDVIEDALARVPWDDHRTRLEHLGNPDFDLELVERMKRTGTIGVPTAAFMYGDGPSGFYAFRTLYDAGLQPPGNSDTAGAQLWATNPWTGIALNVHRTNKFGQTIRSEEALTVDEAIRTYTAYAAYSAGRERQLGSLEVGKAGDVVVLDTDPYAVDAAELAETRTALTILGGSVTWRA